MSDLAPVNRRHWEAISDWYQGEHGASLSTEPAAWGCWRVPERSLRILGDVAGRDVLELGCGAAQWSIALARMGARPVGLDFSLRQLGHARGLMAEAGVDFPLVAAEGERVPLADASFDVVFCDHGVLSWTDPRRTLPEAARLLRPGGLLAFCVASPLVDLCYDPDDDSVGDRLRLPHADVRVDRRDTDVQVRLSHGAWTRALRQVGLVVEDLVELRAPAGGTSTYDLAPTEWAERWPAEDIWKARRAR